MPSDMKAIIKIGTSFARDYCGTLHYKLNMYQMVQVMKYKDVYKENCRIRESSVASTVLTYS